MIYFGGSVGIFVGLSTTYSTACCENSPRLNEDNLIRWEGLDWVRGFLDSEKNNKTRRAMIRTLAKVQDDITSRVEALENDAAKTEKGEVIPAGWRRDIDDKRARKVTTVLQDGRVFEKAGTGLTVMTRTLTPAMARHMSSNHPQLKEKLKLGDGNFSSDYKMWVVGLSAILHPVNPNAPTVHFNYRYFEVTKDREEDGEEEIVAWWFGGGTDLTPIYLYEEDARHFHGVFKGICDEHDTSRISPAAEVLGLPPSTNERPSRYSIMKKAADDYFYNKARGEHRGVGGIFFDDFQGNPMEEADPDRAKEGALAFVTSCANSFGEAYWPILERRMNMPYGKKEEEWRNLRHGRYVEYNLVYVKTNQLLYSPFFTSLQDRGTRFGYSVPGIDIEAVLMSLPLNVRFEYRNEPEVGSREQELLDLLKALTESEMANKSVVFSSGTNDATPASSRPQTSLESKQFAVPERPGTTHQEYTRATTAKSSRATTAIGSSHENASRPESSADFLFELRHGFAEPIAVRAARRQREAAIEIERSGGPLVKGFLIPNPDDYEFHPRTMKDINQVESLQKWKRIMRRKNLPYEHVGFWDLVYSNTLDIRKSLEEKSAPDWHDYYMKAEKALTYIEEYLASPVPCSVLHIGCGSSALSHFLGEKYPHCNLTNIDISRVLIEKLCKYWNATDRESVEYRNSDCRELFGYPDQSFDIILDKATFDILLCDTGGAQSIRRMLEESWRVLKKGGTLIIFSTGGTLMRSQYFKRSNPFTSRTEKQTYNWRHASITHGLGVVHILVKQEIQISEHLQRLDRERSELLRRLRYLPHFTSINLDQFFLDVHTLSAFDEATLLKMLETHKPGYLPPKKSMDNDDSESSADGEEDPTLEPMRKLRKKQAERAKKKRDDIANRKLGKIEPPKVGIALEAEKLAKQLKGKALVDAAEAFQYEHIETEEEKAKREAKARTRLPQVPAIDPSISWREDYKLENGDLSEEMKFGLLIRQLQRYTSYLYEYREKTRASEPKFASKELT
eukprot:g2851.t1